MKLRRAGLGALLLVVALLAIAVPVLLRPEVVTGAGTVAPMPEPPQIGECLLTGDSLRVVPCSEEHDAEVTARWLADDPERALRGSDEDCSPSAIAYMNYVPDIMQDEWTVGFVTEPRRIDAPSEQRAGTRGWTVCAITAGLDGKVTGSLRSITAIHRPEATARCLNESSPEVAVPCDEPHTLERLANTWRLVPDPEGIAPPLGPDGRSTTAPVPADLAVQLDSECSDVAASLLQTTDPTRGGLLKTATRNAVISSAPPERPGTVIVSALCMIGPTDDRRLTGTLLALGDPDVPLE